MTRVPAGEWSPNGSARVTSGEPAEVTSAQALRTVAAFGLPGSQLRPPAAPLSAEAWQLFSTGVRRQRLSGLLLAAVHAGQLPVQEDQRRQVVAMHTVATTHVLRLEGFLLRSLDRFAAADIEVRLLKGSAVAHLDYPNPTLRPFADVDLLVRSKDFDRATRALLASGHRRYFTEMAPGFDRRFSKGVSFASAEDLQLDLHRTLAQGPFGLTLRLDDLWASHRHFTLAGRRISALGDDERFLHACYHAALGDFPPKLQPHRDVAQMALTGSVDPARVLQLARRWRGEAVVARAISTAWSLFDVSTATALSTWAEGYRGSGRERRRLGVYTQQDRSYAALSLASIGALPSLRDRIALIRMIASPDQSLLSHLHRSRLSWLLDGARRAARTPHA
jgi:hypothetical protein